MGSVEAEVEVLQDRGAEAVVDEAVRPTSPFGPGSIDQSSRGCTLIRACRRVDIAWKTVSEMAQTEMTTGSQRRKASAQSFQRTSSRNPIVG